MFWPSLHSPFRASTAASVRPPGSGMRPFWLVVLASLWMATVGNLALWREISRLPSLATAEALTHTQALTLSLVMALLVALLTTALISLMAWRWTLKPVITVFWVSAALGAYFMMSYGVVIDKTMMVNTLQTDFRETRDLFNWRLLATVVVMAVLPGYLLWKQPVRRQSVLRQLSVNLTTFTGCMVVFAVVLMLFFQSIAPVMHTHTHLRYLINPLNSFYALGQLAAKPFQKDSSVILPLGRDAKLGTQYAGQPKPPLLLLVLGETARSGNFGVNGYARNTTPELAAEHIATQRNAWSCGTSTAASLPCMFSNAGREGYSSRADNAEGVLDVLQHAGLAVLWVDNQSGCKGVCDRVHSARSVDDAHPPVPTLCPGGECFDEIMLQGLDERIAALPAEQRTKGVVVVLHQMGSHGPAYTQRSPAAFKRFMPECTNNALQSCAASEVVNVYDNSIAYTDHVLGLAIRWLKTQQTHSTPAMVYVADHGESLGENNLYLHGMPYGIAPDVQKRVPWITWLSPGFEQRSHVTTACLQQGLDTAISHDNYFHSVLGLMNVTTGVYRNTLDIYAPCAAAKPA
ncbi:MAG: phosphoethanolamine transferase [Polaromonas sp.]